jgi:hypothetical protein
LDKIIRPELGAMKIDKLTRGTVARLHRKLKAMPFQANRVLAVIGSMYAFAARAGLVPDGMNPARKIENFAEHRRERFLTRDAACQRPPFWALMGRSFQSHRFAWERLDL